MGITQGSVVGPVLFILSVRDILPILYSDMIRPQFADDIITLTKLTNSRSKVKYI